MLDDQNACISTLRMPLLVSQISPPEIPPLSSLRIHARPGPDVSLCAHAIDRCSKYAGSHSKSLSIASTAAAITRICKRAIDNSLIAPLSEFLDSSMRNTGVVRFFALASANRSDALASAVAAILSVARSDASSGALDGAIAKAITGDDAVDVTALAVALAVAAVDVTTQAKGSVDFEFGGKIAALSEVDDISFQARCMGIDGTKRQLFTQMIDAYAACAAVTAMRRRLHMCIAVDYAEYYSVMSWIAADVCAAGEACSAVIGSIEVAIDGLLATRRGI